MIIEQSKLNERHYGQVKRKINMAKFKLEKSHTLTGPWNHVSWEATAFIYIYKSLCGTLH